MWRRFGVVPPTLLGGRGLITPLTSMFLHAGWIHLISNMWFLFIFGEGVEDALGRVRFALFYVIAGVLAMVSQAFVEPESMFPIIGASGAISAVLGGYVVLYPKTRVLTLVPFLIVVQFVEVPAFLFVFVWLLIQGASAWFALSTTGDSSIAWFAHLGGFFVGALYVKLFARIEQDQGIQKQTNAT